MENRPRHIAILMSNTDRSRFAARHPRDGEKWRALLEPLRPDWRFSVWNATEGELPEAGDRLDGAIVTGSPASAAADDPWILGLLDRLRELHARRLPLFGACFGHQAIARALGGSVGANPGPFVLGNVDIEIVAATPWMTCAPPRIRLAAAHGEQVTALPDGAEVFATGPGCPVGGYFLADRVFATEYHPEMTPEFLAALVEALDGKLDPQVVGGARASLDPPSDRALFADWIVRFFEAAGATPK